MTYGATRTDTTGRAAGRRLFWGVMALLSLMLAFAPGTGSAATFSAMDGDAIGRWVGDIKEPNNPYEVVAGPRAGELRLISPAAQKLPPIALHRVAADAFASTPGTAPVARLTLVGARHAHLNIYGGVGKKRILFTYLLLEKQ